MFRKKLRKSIAITLLLSLCRAEGTKDPPREPPPEKTPQQALEDLDYHGEAQLHEGPLFPFGKAALFFVPFRA